MNDDKNNEQMNFSQGHCDTGCGCHENEEPLFDNSDTYVRKTPKTGRNEPCICGSGKKYKKCCLN